MKKMLQRVISILLTLVMILQVFPATIFATEDESTISDDIVFDNAQSLTAVEILLPVTICKMRRSSLKRPLSGKKM